MAVKNILLTFDYELFLGNRSGTAEKCILQPTERLQKILGKYQARAVFFVDVLCLVNFAQHKALHGDLEKINKQLLSLFNDGHYIFPHIHSHWLDAKYITENNQFDLSDLSKYSLSVLEPGMAGSLFKRAIDYLESAGIKHTSWGYRAGGWCVQPFEKFKSAFEANNINHEFSVLPGYKNESVNQAFDYSMVTETEPYYFSDNVEKPFAGGKFVEYPISTIMFSGPVLFTDRLVRKYLWKNGDRGFGDGVAAKTASLGSTGSRKEMVSIELLTVAKLATYKNYLQSHNYMHWISHPKMFTKHGLNMFERFLKYAHSDFDTEYDFIKMQPQKAV